MDYTKLLAKLIPEAGGEDVLRLRVGVVDAVNTDGTVDVGISGLVIPDVPRLAEASVQAGAVVQLLSFRGSLIVIGQAAVSDASPGLGMWTRGQSTSASSAITSTTPVTTGLVTDSGTFIKNRVYEVRTQGGVSANVANSYMDLRPFRGGPATQLGEWFRFPIPTNGPVYNATAGGIYFTPGSVNVTGTVALYGASNIGTTQVTHFGIAGAPRNIETWDVGDISQFPGIVTW